MRIFPVSARLGLAAKRAGDAELYERSGLKALEEALTDVLAAFRIGENSLFASLFAPRVTKVLFAATKADHLHHVNHDRLEAILRLLVRRAHHRAESSGAPSESLAVASIRATRELVARENGVELPCVAGIPIKGETLGAKTYDGETEAAIFPGDLPADPDVLFRQVAAGAAAGGDPAATASLAPDVSFVRFRPPRLERTAEGMTLSLPHIRLDRVLEFLIGDRLT